MKIVEGGNGGAIDKSNRSTSKSRYGRGVCVLSSFYDSQGCRYDTIYRDDVRYRILPQLQSEGWPEWVDEYYEYRSRDFREQVRR